MRDRKHDRNCQIYEMWKTKLFTLREIGTKFSITPERVRQIARKYERIERYRGNLWYQ